MPASAEKRLLAAEQLANLAAHAPILMRRMKHGTLDR
jgi:hypothetical protein